MLCPAAVCCVECAVCVELKHGQEQFDLFMLFCCEMKRGANLLNKAASWP